MADHERPALVAARRRGSRDRLVVRTVRACEGCQLHPATQLVELAGDVFAVCAGCAPTEVEAAAWGAVGRELVGVG